MLTALTIENAKPRDKPYKLSDGNGRSTKIAGLLDLAPALKDRMGSCAASNRRSQYLLLDVITAQRRNLRPFAQLVIIDELGNMQTP